MSYEDNGIEFEGDGLGAILQTNTANAGVRAMQQDLQRLGRLAAGTGSSGADGRWGPITSAALTAAARAAGWTGAPFTQRTSSTVEVPDELLARIHAAATTSTAPGPTATTTSADLVPSPTTTTTTTTSMDTPPIIPSGPGILPGTAIDTATPPSTTNWPLIILGGGVVAVAVGVIVMSLGSPGMAKNRRVRRNRVRRNKTKRTRRYRAR